MHLILHACGTVSDGSFQAPHTTVTVVAVVNFIVGVPGVWVGGVSGPGVGCACTVLDTDSTETSSTGRPEARETHSVARVRAASAAGRQLVR